MQGSLASRGKCETVYFTEGYVIFNIQWSNKHTCNYCRAAHAHQLHPQIYAGIFWLHASTLHHSIYAL